MAAAHVNENARPPHFKIMVETVFSEGNTELFEQG